MTEGIWAKSILASEHSITGKRLDTILCRMPRCILAEFNTHRAFSRNAASSRAIPVSKMMAQIENDPFIPVKWTKNEPGMQGYEELESYDAAEAKSHWCDGRWHALEQAKKLNALGAHKQVINRLLEPWMWTIVLVTATEWENFFALRDHPAAEPHMQLLAQAIYRARMEANRKLLEPGQWHLPFIHQTEWHEWVLGDGVTAEEELRKLKLDGMDVLKILSVARCASTSYKTVDGFDMTLDRAQKIYDSLLSDPLHASPFEHAAQADKVVNDDWGMGGYLYYGEHRNFIGFRQLRAQIEAKV